MNRIAIAVLGGIAGAAITAGSQIYISGQSRAETDWTLPGDPSNPSSAYVFEHIDRDYWVCYTEGDSNFVYIDNKNSLLPFNTYEGVKANYPRIRLGDCEPVKGGDQVNIGFFLDTKGGATNASGTLRVLDTH